MELYFICFEANRALLDEVDDISDPVKKAIKKFGHHPSIIDIKRNVSISAKFSFIAWKRRKQKKKKNHRQMCSK